LEQANRMIAGISFTDNKQAVIDKYVAEIRELFNLDSPSKKERREGIKKLEKWLRTHLIEDGGEGNKYQVAAELPPLLREIANR